MCLPSVGLGLFRVNMLFFCAVLLFLITFSRSDSPPNIVLIIADDLGWNDAGWNNPSMITPNLNKLAKEGVILDNMYVQPMCSPTRAAILTGHYPYHMGLQHLTVNQNGPKYIPEDIPLLPEKLKELNYKTHMIGKWHVGNCNVKYTPTRRGFDSFLGFYTGSLDYYNRTVAPNEAGEVIGKYDFRRGTDVYYPPPPAGYLTNLLGSRAVDVISKHDHQHPLYLHLAFNSPHSPLEVPKKFEEMYKCVKDEDRRIFSGMVTSFDNEIGKVVKALEQHNFMENTIIFFLADNGGLVAEAGNNMPLRGQKRTLWEGGTKSASFVYSKTLLTKSGYRNNKVMHAVDVFPTILSVAGGIPDEQLDGRNQWPAMSVDAESARVEFVYNVDEMQENAAIRVGDLKLIEGPASVDGFDYFYLLPLDNCGNSHIGHWSDRVYHQRKIQKYNGRFYYERDRENQQQRQILVRDNCVKGDHSVMYRLYNLTRDPGERFNLACHNPDLLNFMIDRLNYFKESLVTAQELSNTEDFGVPYINDVISHQWC